MSAAPALLATPQRPAELVETVELLYRGIFSSGLLVAVGFALFALVTTPLQPGGDLLISAVLMAGVVVLLAGCLAGRASCYAALRRRPLLIVAIGVVVGLAAAATGPYNQQFFYVQVMTFGVLGLAVPFPHVLGAATLASLGAALPHLLTPTPTIGFVVPALVIPLIFWVIIELLARFLLRSCSPAGAGGLAGDRAADREGAPPESWAGRRSRRVAGRLRRPRRRLELARAAAPVPDAPGARLTARQLETVLLCAEGLNHLEVAACLGLHPQQVRRHLTAARARAGAATNAQLVAWAMWHGLIPGPQPAPAGGRD